MYKLIGREVCYENGGDNITFRYFCKVNGEDGSFVMELDKEKGIKFDRADRIWEIRELKALIKDAEKIMKEFN